jgi:site-specific recombinase XerD
MRTPEKQKTTTHSLALFQQTLTGKNYSPQSIKAYRSDLEQFLAWLKTRRVDWDIPNRLQNSSHTPTNRLQNSSHTPTPPFMMALV